MNRPGTEPAPALAGAHLRTYRTIFRHPASHNLGWHDVHALFRRLGRFAEEPNGNFRATRNGQTLVLPPVRTKDVGETDELMHIREFLERTGVPALAGEGPVACRLVVINHHAARLFDSVAPGTSAREIRPRQSEDSIRHAHRFDGFSRGQEKPAPRSFFGPVAEALRDAPRILVFGGGTGMASEMIQFVAWLGVHFPAIALRIAGTQVIDEHHLTDEQLLATARAFGSPPRAAGVSAG